MVYFQINRVGYNCGYDKKECKRYPDQCMECIKDRFAKLGLDVNHSIKIDEMDSEDRRIQMFRDLIWQKFLDVLNIKHILLMTKDSGLTIVNYPISGAGVDVGLLTGFIQANVAFSETSDNTHDTSNFGKDHHFYEFQYKNFNILLKSGKFITVCLVLDSNASESLKSLVMDFLKEYEIRYQEKLQKFIKTGALEFETTIDFIVDIFNIKLVFPMILTHIFLPDILDAINKNIIQKAVIKFAKEFLATKQFFFINDLVNEVQKIVDIDAKIILYEVYQLLEKRVILPTTIETAENKVKTFQESNAVRIANNELISPIISTDNAIEELKEKAKTMDANEAKKLMNNYIKKGQTAEKALVYKEALKEYEKALYLASGFDFKEDIGSISFMVLELDKKIKQMEIDYNENAGEKAEKNKEYIHAIGYYQKALEILNAFAISNDIEVRIKKFEKKLSKLQKQI